MIKKLILAMFVLTLALAWAGCGGLPKSAVAQVDGKVITREDLDSAIVDLKAQYGDSLPASDTPEYTDLQKQVAERLVNEEILWFEADKMNLDVTDDEINQQIDQYKQQAGGDDAFNQKLQENNTTLDRLKDQVRKSLLFQKIYPEVTKDAPQVTDEQALAYYNANPDQFKQPETVNVRHILVPDEATANAVEARLAAGEDFATVAKEVSQDPGSKDKGGDLGKVSRDGTDSTGSSFAPEFVQAMNSLTVGQISAPVKTTLLNGGGYFIIQVTAVNPAGQQTFDQVKTDLVQGLATENQRTAFEAWFEEIKKQYADKIEYAEEFKPTPTTPTTATTATTATQAQPTP